MKAHPSILSLIRATLLKAATIVGYSVLLVREACPAWFLGLFIAVTFLQCLGIVLMLMPGSRKFVFTPLRISKWNTALQLNWIAIVLLDVSLPKVGLGYLTWTAGYLLLAALQIMVFARYCYRYRWVLIRHLSLPSSLLPETT